jgi:hypothetical protein
MRRSLVASTQISTAAGFRGGGLFRRFFFDCTRGFLLAFHLREALLQRGHQIDHGSQFLRLFDFRHFSAFELGFDQFLQVFLE